MDDYKIGFLEKFGIQNIERFKKNSASTFDHFPEDKKIKQESKKILGLAILFITMVSIICIFPQVFVDVKFENLIWWKHYGIYFLTIIIITALEFYLLFLIALWAVHKIGDFLHCYIFKGNTYMQGPFSIINILARTAMEIEEPLLPNIGIDPFKQISKRNLFIIGLMYKLKIFLSNLILKYLLLFAIGKTIFGISIGYAAIFVEVFWNIMVIIKIVKEARLRIFGYALANKIIQKEREEETFIHFSTKGKESILRAIGNSVVIAQNYHPNMMILYFEFLENFENIIVEKADEWNLFLENLNKLNNNEKNATLDMLAIAAAFDGKISESEHEKLKEAFGKYSDVYYLRINKLKNHLNHGEVNAAFLLCDINYIAG